MQHDYWLRRTGQQKLFPELEWEKPERRDQRGKLAVIGGTKLGFASVAGAYTEANEAGAGQVRAVVPDALKSVINDSMEDIIFTASNTSGAFSKDAENDINAAAEWADMLLLIGDTGRNSETAVTFEQMLTKTDTPCVITRDAVDLLKASPELLLGRENTALVVSFSQLQKLLRAVYFPRNIIFSMHLSQFVEVLHKVTLSYPALIATYHSEQLIISFEGRVATIPLANPMPIWRGTTATQIAVNIMQHPGKPFEAAVQSV